MQARGPGADLDNSKDDGGLFGWLTAMERASREAKAVAAGVWNFCDSLRIVETDTRQQNQKPHWYFYPTQVAQW